MRSRVAALELEGRESGGEAERKEKPKHRGASMDEGKAEAEAKHRGASMDERKAEAEAEAEAKPRGASMDEGKADHLVRGRNLKKDIDTLVHQEAGMEVTLLNLNKLRNMIRNELDRLEEELKDEMQSPQKIIAFVDAIEKAEQYLELMFYVRQMPDIECNSDEIQIFKGLVQHQIFHKFDKLDFEDFMNAVHDHILDLQVPTSCEDYLQETVGDHIRKNPIINLVHHALHDGYVMDRDPLAELNIIEKSNPIFYQNFFRGLTEGLTEKHSGKMLVARNVPSTYQENDIKAVFSECGKIEFVKFERDGQLHKVAYVTFANSEGAKLAPFLMERGDHHISITPVLEPNEFLPPTDTDVFNALERYKSFLAHCAPNAEETAEQLNIQLHLAQPSF